MPNAESLTHQFCGYKNRDFDAISLFFHKTASKSADLNPFMVVADFQQIYPSNERQNISSFWILPTIFNKRGRQKLSSSLFCILRCSRLVADCLKAALAPEKKGPTKWEGPPEAICRRTILATDSRILKIFCTFSQRTASKSADL